MARGPAPFALALLGVGCAPVARPAAPPTPAATPDLSTETAIRMVSLERDETAFRATAAYSVHRFESGQYQVIAQLATTDGPLTWGPDVALPLVRAAGTVGLVIPLAPVVAEPTVARPERLKLVIVSRLEERVARVVAESGWSAGAAPPQPALAADAGARPEAEPEPRHEIALHALRTANDDGSEETIISPHQVSRWVAKTNEILARSRAGIRLRFDPRPEGADWEPVVNDSALNHLAIEDRAAVARANRRAARHPRKLLVIFRHSEGRGRQANRGNGFAGPQFIALPAFDQTLVPSNVDEDGQILSEEKPTQNIWQMAHDLGHFLGLRHTFASEELQSRGQLARFVARHGYAALDGDRIDDTPPDIGPFLFRNEGWPACSDADAEPMAYVARRDDGSLVQFPVTVARHNVMSYFACEPMAFSPGQVQVMRRTLERPERRRLIGGRR